MGKGTGILKTTRGLPVHITNCMKTDEMGHGMGRGLGDAGRELETDINADREDKEAGGAGIYRGGVAKMIWSRGLWEE
jgi:hypothetical protein